MLEMLAFFNSTDILTQRNLQNETFFRGLTDK